MRSCDAQGAVHCGVFHHRRHVLVGQHRGGRMRVCGQDGIQRAPDEDAPGCRPQSPPTGQRHCAYCRHVECPTPTPLHGHRHGCALSCRQRQCRLTEKDASSATIAPGRTPIVIAHFDPRPRTTKGRAIARINLRWERVRCDVACACVRRTSTPSGHLPRATQCWLHDRFGVQLRPTRSTCVWIASLIGTRCQRHRLGFDLEAVFNDGLVSRNPNDWKAPARRQRLRDGRLACRGRGFHPPTLNEACNANRMQHPEEDGSCLLPDECGVCGGDGIARGRMRLRGQRVDDCGVCARQRHRAPLHATESAATSTRRRPLADDSLGMYRFVIARRQRQAYGGLRKRRRGHHVPLVRPCQRRSTGLNPVFGIDESPMRSSAPAGVFTTANGSWSASLWSAAFIRCILTWWTTRMRPFTTAARQRTWPPGPGSWWKTNTQSITPFQTTTATSL